jgi:general secretion pathway protein A
VYESYYGFKEKPFNLTPDPKYLYLSQRHTEAFAHLEFGRRERGGFAVITGDVGTGKTTLARYFLSQLGPTTATAVVLYPALTAAELLRSILEDLHVQVRGDSLKDLVDALHRFLLEARTERREVVLLIDEAQDLSAEVLEQIRLLSNLETDTEKLIQIVLMGQSELQDKLARHDLRQLAQRVTARYHLGPLQRQETEEYILHRLKVADGENKVAFTPGALTGIHRFSCGVPRLINVICDRALLAGYVDGTRTIHAALVERASREVSSGLPARRGTSLKQMLRYAVGGLAAGGAGLVAGLWLQSGQAAAPPGAPRPVAAAAVADAAAATLPPAPGTAPPASLALSPSPAATAPSGPSRIDGVLLSVTRETSFNGAVSAVQARWGQMRLEATFFRTHLDQIRRLDMPVILEMFHPARRDTCYLALLELGDQEALLSAGESPFRVPVADMDRYWTRQALFLWRDFEALGQGKDPARAAAWARMNLTRLGYLTPEGDLAEAVTRFQRDLDLSADGLIGSRTLLALYGRGSYSRPRLLAGGHS